MAPFPRSLAAFVTLALTAAAARADLLFAEPAVDAGEAHAGPTLAHRFAFVNRGPATVEITDVRASCGCLKPKLEPRTYRPGEQGALLLEVNTLSQPPGPNTWRAQVLYRDGDVEREAAVQVRARLTVEVTVQPAAMTVFTDKAAAHEIILLDRRPRPLKLTGVRASSPHLKAELAEQFPDALARWVARVRVAVAADCPDGRHEEVVSLFSDDPGYRELRVPVTVVKRPRQRVTATPALVTLQGSPGQPVPARIVLLRDAEGQAVEVEAVTADDPALACTWARGPGAMATLRVTADRSRIPGGKLHSALHVRLSQPVSQTLTIPVSCVAP